MALEGSAHYRVASILTEVLNGAAKIRGARLSEAWRLLKEISYWYQLKIKNAWRKVQIRNPLDVRIIQIVFFKYVYMYVLMYVYMYICIYVYMYGRCYKPSIAKFCWISEFAEFPGFFSFELLIKLIKLLMIKKYTCA